MSRYRRLEIQGGVFFLTLCARRPRRRRCWFVTSNACGADMPRSGRSEPFLTPLPSAFCPITSMRCWRLPDGDADYAARWKPFPSVFLARPSGGENAVRQQNGEARKGASGSRRYLKHAIRDDPISNGTLIRIHYNPGEARVGDVASLTGRISSFHRYVAQAYCSRLGRRRERNFRALRGMNAWARRFAPLPRLRLLTSALWAKLLYQLYRLSPEERNLVENEHARPQCGN